MMSFVQNKCRSCKSIEIRYKICYTMSGSYYDASTNRYDGVPESKKYDTRYSSKFNNDQWRKNYAVIGYLNSWTQWDSVGDVAYKYNGSTKITHRHNF